MRERIGTHSQRIIVVVGLLLLIVAPGWAQEVGQQFPPWSPGILDIHQINTGRGNSALLIFPDGTTLLVDAGDVGQRRWDVVATKPEGSNGGERIARYARHMLAHDTTPSLDYALLTHFHDDHMGTPNPDSEIAEGGYALSGITAVAERIPVGTLMDRGWPDYSYPAPIEGALIENYRAFVDWQIEASGLTVERFEPGRADQIVLRREPSRYRNFVVRNIAVNGEIWTGVGTNTRQYFPPLEDVATENYPTENLCSVAVRLSYGKFDYYTGGDVPGVPVLGMLAGVPSWHDVEIPVARAVGAVEVAVLNHHGMRDSTSVEFLQSTRPRVIVIPVWGQPQPAWSVLTRVFSTRVYEGPRDAFLTNISAANHTVLERPLRPVKSTHGHTVVRVSPGGDSFQVLVLEDSDESYRIREIFGPYQSR